MKGVWFLAGTAAGAYATTRLRRLAEGLTHDGVHDRLTGWFAGARVLGEELRLGMEEKETELRARVETALHGDLGAAPPDPAGVRRLEPAGRRELTGEQPRDAGTTNRKGAH